MSKTYHKTPAEILFLEDEYTAYCFNEACALIRMKLENKETPVFQTEVQKEYKSFSDMYKKYEK